jgi:hypothetical protein
VEHGVIQSSFPKTCSTEILLDGQVSDDSIKVCVGSKYLPDGRKFLNKAEHFSLNFVQKRLSNDCVTVSVDVDENKDCVTRLVQEEDELNFEKDNLDWQKPFPDVVPSFHILVASVEHSCLHQQLHSSMVV